MRVDRIARLAIALSVTICWVPGESLGANQTTTTTPVIVGGDLPYSVEVRRYDMGDAGVPSLHSFAAGEHDGQWVVVAGLTNGLHGFDLNRDTLPESKQNREVWVIDPLTKESWSRTLDPSDPGSGFTEEQVLSITPANTQFEQVGDTLYMIGGYGDDDPVDPNSRNTFSTLTAFDLPEMIDWVKGGAGQASDHVRQIEDPLFKVTGGDLYDVEGQMQLVFGQDYQGRYRGNLNGEYTKQVRTFTIQDDGTNLGFTHVGSSTPEDHFRRRDLNVYPSLKKEPDGTLQPGVTVLSGVFTETNGIWTVPVEIDASGQPNQIDNGLDPLNGGGELDASSSVFRQGMNNYHSAKVGLFSEETGDMHQLLFGGITRQEYDPGDPAADANGFVTDDAFPNTSQISGVIRRADGSYEQHFLGAYPEMLTPGGDLMRFGANAEFFFADDVPIHEHRVLQLDMLPTGENRIGFIYGGLIANAPHVFGNPTGLSAASGEVFEVILTIPIPEPGSLALMLTAFVYCGTSRYRRAC